MGQSFGCPWLFPAPRPLVPKGKDSNGYILGGRRLIPNNEEHKAQLIREGRSAFYNKRLKARYQKKFKGMTLVDF